AQRHRRSVYDRHLAQYFQEPPGAHGDSAAVKNYADGRPALRAYGENAPGRDQRASPNYIKPIVKDLVAIRGGWPTTTVPPASAEPSDRDRATLLTRALRQQHEHSAMVRQQQRSGFFLSCLGDSCYTLDPRSPQMARDDPDPFRPVGVYFTVINPRQAFPGFRPGGGEDDLDDLFYITRLSREEVLEQYPAIR